jgi:phosphoglycolate phosphatase-like HAD superfamily hydrolase
MASVLWLDFEGVVVEAGLTDAIIAEYGLGADAGANASEPALAAAIARFEAPREEVESRVRELARPRPGFEELIGWAQWHGWLPIVVSTAPDVCVETVLEDPAFDRVTRHCGRTRQVYRWRLTYASPRGVELEEGFLLSYAAALRDAGDLVVHVGAQPGGEQAARLAHATCTAGPLREALGEGERAHGFETLEDVRAVLEREGEGWRASFATGTG